MDRNRGEIERKVTEIAERVGGPEGLEIVAVELLGGGQKRVLRICIDRPPVAGIDKQQGVSHADCEFISQQVGTILDIEDVIPGASYTLEVSSPGLERKLTRPQDFERFVGQKVKVALRQPVENQRHWMGALKSFAEGIVTLEPSPGRTVQFSIDQIEKANLKFEW
ncbi:MAG TPA: ribosome maturation factor RimP [Bryobacteraceae bacterium]|nr:ribosome maturation factor RimP [Bryobacteraceae bacterium]